jgi:glycine cleavage system H lipoate-binding protein
MNNTTEIMPLILAGDGYQLTISEEAIQRKADMLLSSLNILIVTNNDESAVAQHHTRKLAAMRIEVEKSRKLVKEPINRIGKMIDQAAAEFLVEITAEEGRIKQLVGRHAEEVLRIKAEKEAAERAAFKAARAAREAATEGGIAAVIAAKRATAEKLEASNEVAATKVAEGVRFAWDFEVVDINKLLRLQPQLVTVEPRRSAILDSLKRAEDNHYSVSDVHEIYSDFGIRAFKKPVVSSR